ncbi:MAG: hypothetical protein K6G50_10940, partial [bacterium]|nr:hypothetical protein [bacterium]
GELLSRQTQIMAACLSQGVEIPYMPSPFSASGILGRTLSAEPSASALPDLASELPVPFNAAITAVSDPASTMMIHGSPTDASTGYVRGYKPSLAPAGQEVWMNREQCLQFATGRIGDVLGPKFAEIDNHPTRVRLPDEPLMLVDRIISIEGEPLSLGKGRLVTEHDVVPGMWYLDGGRAPVFLSVEAGQADLFLSGWLGIDLVTKGDRVYRLLDATVSFHRGLPVPGETIRYDIRIDRFVHQGSTWLFFFEYEATINGQTFLTMRNGCAGFFTHQEIRDNRGLVLTEAELAPKQGKRLTGAEPLVSLQAASYAEPQVEALRRGDLESCFGSAFAGLNLNNPVRLPDGLLRLIHRIPVCDPNGGRWGLGMVIGEADVHPDDWFLTCHFVDDMVMPGTLMYECCAHALRFLLTSLGWVGENDRIAYEPVPGVHASLKCRGPVLQTTKIVDYQVEIKEIGYKPEPYVIADAIMYADGKRIVGFEDISMQMTGTTGDELKQLWATRAISAGSQTASAQSADAQGAALQSQPVSAIAPDAAAIPPGLIPANLEPGQKPADPQGESMPSAHGDPIKPALYDSNSLLQFARGLPSLAYGPHFAKFDTSFIARLPGPPYQFVDRITSCDHPFMHMGPGGWVEAQYEVPADAWYFRANRQGTMPFCVLLEIPLQVCGWLSAYAGSSATSEKELHYRNLGGTATLYEEITPNTGVMTIRVRMTKASSAGGLIIQSFDMWMGQNGRTIYEGDTTFGFFPPESLANQVGILNTESRSWKPDRPGRELPVGLAHPLEPNDMQVTDCPALALPGKALMMLDDMQIIAGGGPHNLGYISGTKTVDVDEWFFKAHFFQDPVIPGSLGLESFLQLLKGAAIDRWPNLANTHRFECILTGEPHTWVYRGQVVPKNKKVTVEAYVTEIRDGEEPVIKADGFLRVDGRTVYEMKDFGLRLRKN